jgi:hypothetical protein
MQGFYFDDTAPAYTRMWIFPTDKTKYNIFSRDLRQLLNARLEQAAKKDETLAACAGKMVRLCQSLANASEMELRTKVSELCKSMELKLAEVQRTFDGCLFMLYVLCTCVCVCVCVCTYAGMYVYITIRLHCMAHACMRVYVCTCVRVRAYKSMYPHTYICTCTTRLHACITNIVMRSLTSHALAAAVRYNNCFAAQQRSHHDQK